LLYVVKHLFFSIEFLLFYIVDLSPPGSRRAAFFIYQGNIFISAFRGAIERESAAAGVFITPKEPTKDMRREAAAAGFYTPASIRATSKK